MVVRTALAGRQKSNCRKCLTDLDPVWVLSAWVRLVTEGSGFRKGTRGQGLGTRGEGPAVGTRWEAGPFPHPVQLEPPQREAWQGRSYAWRVGDVTHVVYGPWQVVIRNLGARAGPRGRLRR